MKVVEADLGPLTLPPTWQDGLAATDAGRYHTAETQSTPLPPPMCPTWTHVADPPTTSEIFFLLPMSLVSPLEWADWATLLLDRRSIAIALSIRSVRAPGRNPREEWWLKRGWVAAGLNSAVPQNRPPTLETIEKILRGVAKWG